MGKNPKEKNATKRTEGISGSLSRNYTDIHRQQDECDGEKTTSSTPKENPCGVKFTNLSSRRPSRRKYFSLTKLCVRLVVLGAYPIPHEVAATSSRHYANFHSFIKSPKLEGGIVRCKLCEHGRVAAQQQKAETLSPNLGPICHKEEMTNPNVEGKKNEVRVW